VHRGFKGQTVNGLDFVTLSDLTAGGRQVDGFHGVSIEYMRSKKFLQADGGWSRIVWMPSEIKERVKDFIPSDMIEKIATEKEVSNLEELKSFLKERGHPVVQRWVEAKPAEAEAPKEVAAPTLELPPGAIPIQGVPAGLGFKIILKNAKIRAERMIIRVERGK
jgi:acetyl-CoA decarbonylase/synthase complex subunit beta